MQGRRGSGPRSYRRATYAEGLEGFGVTMGESDLWIWARRVLRAEAAAALGRARVELQEHIKRQPEFRTSLTPVVCLEKAPAIVEQMCRAAEAAEVGPMAGVAGAVAQAVAEGLEPLSPEVIVENGGDTYLVTQRARLVGIVAPGSPVSGKLALRVPAGERLAVCTSSGTVGPSLSLGRADVALVVAADGALADAVASGVGNRVQGPSDVEAAAEWGRSVAGVVHVAALCGGRMAMVGELEVVPVSGE